ncbi:hypothetical protein BKA70DRAFT_1413476, partial [Coprinopsis sp. MPI-PUGE-AT-0042]
MLCLPMSIHWRLRHCFSYASQRRAHQRLWPSNSQRFILLRPLEQAASSGLPLHYRPFNSYLANPCPRPHHPRIRRMDQRR